MARYIQSPERENNLKPRIVYPAKLSFRTEGKIMNFSNKQRPKESVILNLYKKNIEGQPLNRKETKTYRKRKITVGKANI